MKNFATWPLLTSLLCGLTCQGAHALTINLDTKKKDVANWTVSEVSGGQIITQPAMSSGMSNGIGTIVFPFTDNDGYWYADNLFSLPSGATRATLKITGLDADDRVVVELNGKIVSNTGTNAPGSGYMTFTDSGVNETYTFTHTRGRQKTITRKGFISGLNDLRLIVNNTGDGIYGFPGAARNTDTFTGITATVTFTPASVRN